MARVASNPAPAPALSPVARQVEELLAAYVVLDDRADRLINGVFEPAAGYAAQHRQIQVDTKSLGYSHTNALRALKTYLQGQRQWND